MQVDGKKLYDWLVIDERRVALNYSDDSPAVTFTVRKIEGRRVFVQVTAHPRANLVRRTAE